MRSQLEKDLSECVSSRRQVQVWMGGFFASGIPVCVTDEYVRIAQEGDQEEIQVVLAAIVAWRLMPQ